jgi:hypothetical protein
MMPDTPDLLIVLNRIKFGRPLPTEYLRFSTSEPASPRIPPSPLPLPIEITASVHSPVSWQGRVGPQPSPSGVSPHDARHALEGRSLNWTHVASSPAQHIPVLSIPGSAAEKLSLTEEGLLRLIGGGRRGAAMGAGDGGGAGGRRECGRGEGRGDGGSVVSQEMNPRWWNAKTVALLQGAFHCWRLLSAT